VDVFSDSLLENIRYGRPSAKREDVEKVRVRVRVRAKREDVEKAADMTRIYTNPNPNSNPNSNPNQNPNPNWKATVMAGISLHCFPQGLDALVLTLVLTLTLTLTLTLKA